MKKPATETSVSAKKYLSKKLPARGTQAVPDLVTDQATSSVVDEPDVRLIAFYLPQYHPIPENDQWWGVGFTEWPGVASARPHFAGHYQPHLPADLGFYDLRLTEVRSTQADLAQQYGIYGFCYHYYWFSGRQVLERPLQEILRTGEPDFPFCVCWANEAWSRRWDGSDKEVLIAQEHDLEVDKTLIIDLLPLLSDRRYIKIGGKPLIIVYRVGLLPDPTTLFAAWRATARTHGFPDLHICMAETFGCDDPFGKGCDASVQFPPHSLIADVINDTVGDLSRGYSGELYSYASAVINEISADPKAYPRYPCVMPGWDNTPRRGLAGNAFHGSTPELYELWLREAIGFTKRRLPAEQRLVFINAWNEWGEGAHLEPDMKFGRRFLEATRRALAGLSTWRTIMAGIKARIPAADYDLVKLEDWLISYETSLKYLSEKYLSIENYQLQLQPSFIDFSETALESMDLKLHGTCYIERINQSSGGDAIRVPQVGHLHVFGWNLLPGQHLAPDTESFLTLIPEGHRKCFTARISKRLARMDVADYYKLTKEEGFWAGIHSSAALRNVSIGRYRLGIDTVIGEACHRTISTQVVEIAEH